MIAGHSRLTKKPSQRIAKAFFLINKIHQSNRATLPANNDKNKTDKTFTNINWDKVVCWQTTTATRQFLRTKKINRSYQQTSSRNYCEPNGIKLIPVPAPFFSITSFVPKLPLPVYRYLFWIRWKNKTPCKRP